MERSETSGVSPFVYISICNKEVSALVDTGASISCMSKEQADKLQIAVNKIDGVVAKAINGQFLDVAGVSDVSWKVSGIVCDVRFYIINKLNLPIILGQDFLSKYGVVIDFSKCHLKIYDRIVNFDSSAKDKAGHTLAENSFAICSKDDNARDELVQCKSLTNCHYVYFQGLLENNEKFLYATESETNDFKLDEKLVGNDRDKLMDVLNENRDRFAFSNKQLGRCTLVEVDIKVSDDLPIRSLPYRMSPVQRQVVDEQIGDMLSNGVIRKSNSAYASPVVLVKKADGRWRFCVDYRKLNKKVISDSYPIPNIDELLNYMAGAQYFADLDMNSGYWQLAISESDKHKTAFVTTSGLYEFNVLPFGLKTSQAVFQRTMDLVVGDLKYKNAIVFVDNVTVFAKTFSEFCLVLERILTRLREVNLTLNPDKCHFGYREIAVLGYKISGEGVMPDPKKIECIKLLKAPTNVKEVRSTLGLFSYYRKFIDNFAKIVAPITNLLKKNCIFQWGDEQQRAFDDIKSRLCNPPILAHYSHDSSMVTRLYVDASGVALGACLMQGRENMKPVVYASRRLSEREEKYSITEKECLSIVWSINVFRHFIWGRKFQIVTDHKALCWLKDRKDVSGRLARWSLSLQEYDFDVIHCSGKSNVVADFLSRNPLYSEDEVCVEQDDGMKVYAIEIMEVQSAQENDSFCSRWRSAVRDSGREVYKGFCLANNILYRKIVKNGRSKMLLVLPRALFNKVMDELHDQAWSGGHLGMAKTIWKFRERYFMVDSVKLIERYVRSCVQCQERKKSNVRCVLQPVSVNGLMEKVGIDIVGPLRKSTRGNKYIIVCIEYVSKYAMCRAVPRVRAQEVCEFLIQEVFCKLGGVRNVISDRGSVFRSSLVKDTIVRFGAKSCFSTAFHPQTSGLVERFNRTLQQMLSMYVAGNQRDWCEYLPLVVYAYNTSMQASSRYSPYYLIHGREPQFQSDLILNLNVNHISDDMNERVNFHHRDVECALRNIRHAQTKQKRLYDKKAKNVSFERNDLVLIYKPRRITGVSLKLSRLYKGPFKIVRRISAMNYVVKKVGNSRFRDVVHVNRIKKFHLRI